MARQLWIATALRNAGLHVIENPGWEKRGDPSFDPKGVVCHHTASKDTSGDVPSLKVVVQGRSDLPGPLCHVLIGRSGTCHVIAAGRANHAGPGQYKSLKGNASVLGIEAENDGIGEPWSPHLIDVFERCAAALARGCLAPPELVCGHKEWTRRKIDPAGIDMGGFRQAVAQLMNPQEDDVLGTSRLDDQKGAVVNLYVTHLGRYPTQQEQDFWVLTLTTEGFLHVVNAIATGEEATAYRAKQLKDT